MRAALWWRSVLLVGLAALGGAIHVTDGYLSPNALAGLTIAIGCCFAGIFLLRTAGSPSPRTSPDLLVLRLVLIIQFGILLTSNPAKGFLRDGNELPWVLVTGVAVAAVAGLVCTMTDRRVGIAAFGLVLVCHFLLGLWFLQHTNRPVVDTLMFQHHGAAALWSGSNPYLMRLADPYSPENSAVFYGPEGSVNGHLTFGFPYPPLSLYLVAPAYWLGDVRYAHLLAMTLATALIGFARPGKWSYGVATIFLFTPCVFLVVGMSWTDPLVVMLLAAAVFCACRRPGMTPWALGLALAAKQYMLLAIPLMALLLPAQFQWKQLRGLLWRSLAVALAVSLPLMLWNVSAFIDDVVLLQFRSPFQHDVLSYMAWLFPIQPPSAAVMAGLPLAAVILTTLFVLWCCPREPSGFALALGMVLLLLFAFGKQGSARYYYFVIGALCCGLATSKPPADARGPASPAPKPPA